MQGVCLLIFLTSIYKMNCVYATVKMTEKIGTSLMVQWLRLCSQGRGLEFNPWSGSQIPHATAKDPLCRNQDLAQPNKSNKYLDFPCGSVVKNPPANAGDVGLIPGRGRFQCPGTTKPMYHQYWAQEMQLLKSEFLEPWKEAITMRSLNTTTSE